MIYPPKKSHVPHKLGTVLKGNFMFQPLIVKGYVSFQGDNMLGPGALFLFVGGC